MVSWVRGVLGRVVADANLDLYLLIATALLFTVLGGFGVSDVKTLSSAVLGLLALMAVSQIKSRNQLSALAAGRDAESTVELRTGFPAEYERRRSDARTFLFIGTAGTRTFQTMRHDLRRMLTTGGSVKVLLIDPTDDRLVHEAALNQVAAVDAERIRARVRATLDELVHLRDTSGGDLQIRVSLFVPNIGFNGIDLDARDGAILVQHYEHRPDAEPAPILYLHRRDGRWYDHYAAEALRIWEDGLPWPATGRPALPAAPFFSDEHGRELDGHLASARRLFVTGVARNSFVHNRYATLERLLRSGCEIRFLLVDPGSPAVATAADRYYADRTTESLRDRIRYTLRQLAELRQTTGGSLTVRLTSHPLAIGLLSAEQSEDAAAAPLYLEYYTYQAPGEPRFSLPPRTPWTTHFLQEAEALWDSGAPAPEAR